MKNENDIEFTFGETIFTGGESGKKASNTRRKSADRKMQPFKRPAARRITKAVKADMQE